MKKKKPKKCILGGGDCYMMKCYESPISDRKTYMCRICLCKECTQEKCPSEIGKE